MAEPKHDDVAPIFHVVGIVPTPHGGLFALKADGSIWERYADPAPRSTPGPAGFLWRKIEGP